MKTKPTTQIYSNYTTSDFLVWKTLFKRQMEILKPIVSAEYLTALEKVKFNSEKIPDFRELNKLLNSLTGWSLEVVPNISPQKEFFEFLSMKKFTATCWLRSMEQLDYLEEPDMFHDVFAHVPLLGNQHYVDFFKGISDIALKHIDNPRAIELLGRIYWFTIEFGLIREQDELKIYGAGIISSMGETKQCLSADVVHLDFDIPAIFHTDFRTDILQEKYFIINSFEQLWKCLPEIESCLQTVLEKEAKIVF
ncbi:MAG: phenylalanine-4-hydroxylase [Bacteroidetes bacterium]|nr:phenylalanine-4-hydroxylase [Bacteroidota bacterium]